MSDYLKFLRQGENSAPAKTVLLVDDSPEVRHVVRTFLECDPSFEVCGEAGDGPEAIKKAEALAPDVVLLKTQIAIFSNYTHDFGARLSSAIGIDAVIAKGSLVDLAKSLKNLIRKDTAS